jgi:hypothetical protein
MSLLVEQECPQCGAPLEMNEADRLVRCGYCNVQSFLSNTGPLHFVLPRMQSDPYTIYAPYLRFKGTIYSCLHDRIEHRLADISLKGIKLPFLPESLGLRPQAMKMRFASPEFPGSFLEKSLTDEDILKRAAQNIHIRDETLLHQAFVGEVLNVIYLPLSIRNEEILDGVLESPLAQIPAGATPFALTQINRKAWKPIFLSALCPQCGWNLEGQPDSKVLLCSNCNSGWQAGDSDLSEVRVKVTPTRDDGEIYLPFWKFEIAAEGIRLQSFADFIRVTNQALVIRPEWEEPGLYFVSPAFKLRPPDFLRLCTQMTISQRLQVQTADTIPVKNLHPVTLAKADAAKSLKVILANSAVARNSILPHLREIKLRIKNHFLHYLPFARTSHELQLKDLAVTINQRVLNYGRSL